MARYPETRGPGVRTGCTTRGVSSLPGRGVDGLGAGVDGSTTMLQAERIAASERAAAGDVRFIVEP